MQAKKSYHRLVYFPLSFESFRYFSKIFFILMLCSIYLDKSFSYFASRILFPLYSDTLD